MARVYSNLFISETLLVGSPFAYTVPDGDVAVIRDILVYTQILDSGGGQITISIGANAHWHFTWPSGAIAPLEWQGRQVLPGASGLTAEAFSSGTIAPTIAISGYLLTP